MDIKQIDKYGYLIFGRSYLYLNIFFDVVDYCKEALWGTSRREIEFNENSEEWQEFMRWRNRYDSNVGPLDS